MTVQLRTIVQAAREVVPEVVQRGPGGTHLELDARAAGVGVAAIAAWRRAPLIVVIVLGALVTVVVRRAS